MSNSSPKRICQVIKVPDLTLLDHVEDPTLLSSDSISSKPEQVAEYKDIHANVWPGVLAALERAHIIDYSIFHYPPLQLLIATMKYTGSDYEADMKQVAEDPETQRWWKVTDGMQESFEAGATGSGGQVPWWTDVEEVFRFGGSK